MLLAPNLSVDLKKKAYFDFKQVQISVKVDVISSLFPSSSYISLQLIRWT